MFAAPPMSGAPNDGFVAQQPPVGATTEAFTSAQIIARIGTETILASDILPLADDALNQQLSKMPKEQREAIDPEELEKTRWLYVQKILEQLIETKMKYADAMANIPKERVPDIKTSVSENFEKTRLKSLMEKYGAANRSELESKMAAAGQSLERQRQLYFEAAMASSWENQHVNRHKEIPVSQVLGYYQQHMADFEFQSKARWEQLMANFEHFSSRQEAYRAICEMGNEVLRGADFAAVAQARSHGPTASKGGQHDWTSQGALVSKEIDAAIFTLPVGRMSQIIEDAKGFHIIRVIERTEAGRKPFLEAQVEIREKLREESIDAQRDEFLAKIKERTPVWTVFGDSSESETIGNRASPQPN
jgi:parvulin-like peptidyl-prolyl isomerase